MDAHFPLSVLHDTLRPGHDTKVGPGRCANTEAQGLADRQLGHDRLMDKVQPRTDTAPPAICPACGAPGDGHHLEAIPSDVPRVQYLCATGEHLWITQWFAGGAA